MLLRIILGGLGGMFCYWMGFVTAIFFKGSDDEDD